MNVTRWFNTVVNQPHAKSVLGPVVLCTKMAEFDAKKYAEFSGEITVFLGNMGLHTCLLLFQLNS